ncbi:SGNH/GDSL hydrolase family protein [Dongia deserti]|uniref:SGNH/GDSL hydrolase family protein n=1 Tax=Dongia deserti TaxID=2268030 RepID=UPI002548EFA0|nr:SGNH/GDSL hydrolase family protein [Dongia deserti]
MNLRPGTQHGNDNFAPGAQHLLDGESGISRRAILAATIGALATAGVARAGEGSAMPHVALLGDSIFDNAAYVGGGPDVIAQVRERLPAGWRATLTAIDGSTIRDIGDQLTRVPSDATHLVVSIGGNDALGYSDILGAASSSVADTLMKLADIQQEFRSGYVRMVEAVVGRKLATAFCTIYDPRYSDPIERRVATTALAVINDVIVREVVMRGLPLIDLRVVCGEDADFANPIEPSVQGGRKIAGTIVSLLTQHEFDVGRSQVFVR